MSKKGENIYKRKDGRWEARYIKSYAPDGKVRYGYCYGRTYHEAKDKCYCRQKSSSKHLLNRCIIVCFYHFSGVLNSVKQCFRLFHAAEYIAGKQS